MDCGSIEKCSLRQSEIGDGVAVVEAFQVGPVLFGIDGSRLGCPEYHFTVERLREDLVEFTLITGDRGAIGEGDSHRRDFGGGSRRLDEGGAEIEEMRPFPWVLGAGCFSVEAIDKGISTIPKQSAFRNLSAVQLLAHHRLHWISPERRHRTKLNLPCVRHSPHSLNGYPLRSARAFPESALLTSWGWSTILHAHLL